MSLISIITPCYNSENYIADTILSVQNQTYTNWEMLITDDGSSDKSLDIIKEFSQNDQRIKLFSIKNSGPAIARNNSIKEAKGKYLAFLDSDDLWFPEFIEKSLIKIKDSEGFVFASYKRCAGKPLKEVHHDFIVPEKVNRLDILKSNSISCLTAFVDIEKLGKEYMPEILYRQDMGLWLKYLNKVTYAKGILEPLAIYRIRENSHSRNKVNLLKPQWYFYRKIEKMNLLRASYIMIIWSIKGFIKYR